MTREVRLTLTDTDFHPHFADDDVSLPCFADGRTQFQNLCLTYAMLRAFGLEKAQHLD
jgi:hypothetical protein